MLSVGSIKKPHLKDIADPFTDQMSFEKYGYYQVLLKMTPESYYTQIKKLDGGEEYWDSLSVSEQEAMTMFDILLRDDYLKNAMLEILNFFFVEKAIMYDGFIVLLKKDVDDIKDITNEDVSGVLTRDHYLQVIDLIQQVCCIKEEEEKIDDSKFKNELARKMFEKMRRAQKARAKKNDINLTLPNIISAVSVKHPSYNLLNIWDLTIFQLLDAFNRLQVDAVYNIDSTRVSVWGDEKKKFDIALWYKNEFDKKNQSD